MSSARVVTVDGLELSIAANRSELSPEAQVFLSKHRSVLAPSASKDDQRMQRIAVPIAVAKELGLCL